MALLYYGQNFFSTNVSTKAGKNLLSGYPLLSTILHWVIKYPPMQAVTCIGGNLF